MTNEMDFKWLMTQGNELASKYAGKWIAVKDCRVVGVGDTALQAALQAEQNTGTKDFILEAIDKSVDVIYDHL